MLSKGEVIRFEKKVPGPVYVIATRDLRYRYERIEGYKVYLKKGMPWEGEGGVSWRAYLQAGNGSDSLIYWAERLRELKERAGAHPCKDCGHMREGAIVFLCEGEELDETDDVTAKSFALLAVSLKVAQELTMAEVAGIYPPPIHEAPSVHSPSSSESPKEEKAVTT